MKVKKQKVSPRQKMINLMYVLLMAMLALNVSSDVLNGFTLVDESLSKSSESTGRQNDALYDAFEMHMQQNPEKVREWYEKGYIRNDIASVGTGLSSDARNVVSFWDTEAEGENKWRSFRYEKLISWE